MLTNHELLLALMRTTLFTSATITLAWLINRSLRTTAPRFQRAAWTLAIAQAWLLVPWTFRVEVERPAPSPVVIAQNVEVTFESVSELRPPVSESNISRPLVTLENVTKGIAVNWIAGAAALILSAAFRYVQFIRHLSLRRVGTASVVISLREMYSCSRSEQPTLVDSAANPDWHAEWQSQLATSRTRRPVALQMTEGLGPLVCFVPFYYLLLAPRRLWQTLSRPERQAILQHELAHLERGDIWKSLLIRLLAMPQWFNPLVWLAVRRFDEAGEWACDDRVAQSNRTSQLHLAKSLIQAAEFITAAAPATASAQGGVLSRRIRRLVTPQIQEGSNMKKGFLCVTLVALAAVQIVRIERVSAAPQDNRTRVGAEETNDDERLAIVPDDADGSDDVNRLGVVADNSDPKHWSPRLGPYVIEPPDILEISINKLVPKPDYTIAVKDALIAIGVKDQNGNRFSMSLEVNAKGNVDLGGLYGEVSVVGKKQAEAQSAIIEHMRKHDDNGKLGQIEVKVELPATAQPIFCNNPLLVGPDGCVNLGPYGKVYVAGKTLVGARNTVQTHLLRSHFAKAVVFVKVASYNSKKFYVVVEDTKLGDNVLVHSATGNETVVDAIASTIGQPPADANLWVARPAPTGAAEVVMPIDWQDIETGESTDTNFALLPGDRLYVSKRDPSTPRNKPVAGAPGLSPAQRYSIRPDGKADPAADSRPILVTLKPQDRNANPQQSQLELKPGMTVEQALFAVPWPHPMPFAKTPIAVHRRTPNGDDEVLPVVWDNETHKPTSKTNYELKPADRIEVEDQTRFAAAATPPTVSPAPDAAPTNPNATIKFDIGVYEDTSGSLAEFMRPGGPAVGRSADTATLRAALRILEKQKLVRRVSDFQALAKSGETASLEVKRADDAPASPADGLQIHVSGRSLGQGLAITYKLQQTERERKLGVSTDMAVATGQSIIAKTHPGRDLKAAGVPEMQADDPESKEENPVYVILTPELVR